MALLRLKAFLKVQYGLTDERCLQYGSEDKTTVDKLSGGGGMGTHVTALFEALPAGLKPLPDTPPDLWLLTGCSSIDTDTVAAGGTIKGVEGLVRDLIADYNRLLVTLDSDSSADFTPMPAGKKRRGGGRGGGGKTSTGTMSGSGGGIVGEEGGGELTSCDGVDKQSTSTTAARTSKGGSRGSGGVSVVSKSKAVRGRPRTGGGQGGTGGGRNKKKKRRVVSRDKDDDNEDDSEEEEDNDGYDSDYV